MPPPFIIFLFVSIPLCLLVMLIVAFVTAFQARRDARLLQVQINQLQRDMRMELAALKRPPGQPAEPVRTTPTVATPPTPPQPPTPQAKAAEVINVVKATSTAPPTPPEKITPHPQPVKPAQPGAPPATHIPVPVQPPTSPSRLPPAKPKPTRTLEERIGTQLPIWIGAIALGIGGIWLAKYLFDQGIFGPTLRVVAGSLFGIGLLLAGAWGHKRNRHIAAAVVAAAVADLYGWVFAAASMYHLVSIWLGFAVMIVITTIAVGLSLRQGPIVAIVGMVGAFLTPVLLRTGHANAGVFAYLFLLQAGLLIVTRRKGWWPLAAFTLAGSILWAGGWVIGMMLQHMPLGHGKWVALFMLGSAATIVFGADDSDRPAWPLRGVGRALSWVALIAALAILSLVLRVTQFGHMEWALMGVLAAGFLALGGLRKAYEPLAWLADGVLLALVTMWSVQLRLQIHDVWQPMAWVMLGFGLLFMVGPYICAWGSIKPARWFGMTAGSAIAWFAIAHHGLVLLPDGWQWWMVALAIAAVLAAMSLPVERKRPSIIGGDESLAWLLIGVSVMLAIAAALGLSDQNVSLAWAMEVPVIALIGCRLRVPRLRWLALATAGGVLVRLVLNPHVLDYPIAEHVVFNWLSYGYGVPIIAFSLAAWIYARHKDDDPLMRLVLEGGAVLLAFMLVSLQIRHGFHRESYRAPMWDWLESATYVNAWMMLALLLLAGASRWARRSIITAGALVGLVACAFLLVALLGVQNPLLRPIAFGQTRVFNWLLYAYGLPIVWLLVAAWLCRKLLPQAVGFVSGAAIAMGFVLVSMQIRHGFHPLRMRYDQASLVELATYCIAWYVLGAALLAASHRWLRKTLETAGLGIGVLAMISTIAALMVAANPWWKPESVGTMRVFNWLLYIYGLPMALCAVLGGLARTRQSVIAAIAAVLSLVLLWLLVTLEVRQWFAGEFLDSGIFTKPEQYAYSAAWVLLGLGLLAAGIALKGKLLRFASLAVMLLAVFKVFIFDTRHLEDLYRVFSFIGLGVSLLVLAFCYQRFVFRRSPATSPPNQSPDESQSR